MEDTEFYKSVKDVVEYKANHLIHEKLSSLHLLLESKLSSEDLDKLDIPSIISSATRNIKVVLCENTIKKPRKKKEILGKNRCQAKIGLGTQCTRSKFKDEIYCKSHSKRRPYGDYTIQSSESKKLNILDRLKDTSKKVKLADLDTSLYIQGTIFEYNGNTLINDENGFILNESLEIIGKIKGEGIEWYKDI